MVFTRLIQVSNLVSVLCPRSLSKCPVIPSLAATCWVLKHLCGMVSGICQVRSAEFIRPKHTQICPHERRTCSTQMCEGKMSSIRGPHNSMGLIFCLDPNLNRDGTLRVRRMGLIDLPLLGGDDQAWVRWWNGLHPRVTQFSLSQILAKWTLQELQGGGWQGTQRVRLMSLP